MSEFLCLESYQMVAGIGEALNFWGTKSRKEPVRSLLGALKHQML